MAASFFFRKRFYFAPTAYRLPRCRLKIKTTRVVAVHGTDWNQIKEKKEKKNSVVSLQNKRNKTYFFIWLVLSSVLGARFTILAFSISLAVLIFIYNKTFAVGGRDRLR